MDDEDDASGNDDDGNDDDKSGGKKDRSPAEEGDVAGEEDVECEELLMGCSNNEASRRARG